MCEREDTYKSIEESKSSESSGSLVTVHPSTLSHFLRLYTVPNRSDEVGSSVEVSEAFRVVESIVGRPCVMDHGEFEPMVLLGH